MHNYLKFFLILIIFLIELKIADNEIECIFSNFFHVVFYNFVKILLSILRIVVSIFCELVCLSKLRSSIRTSSPRWRRRRGWFGTACGTASSSAVRVVSFQTNHRIEMPKPERFRIYIFSSFFFTVGKIVKNYLFFFFIPIEKTSPTTTSRLCVASV